MKSNRITFPVIAMMLLGFCSLGILAAEYGRVAPDLLVSFAAGKVFFGIFSLSLAWVVYRNGLNDLTATCFFVGSVAYTLMFMWYAPIYEMGYVQCAIASAFFPIKRKWLFPVVFGLGFLGIVITYEVQDSTGWILPEVTRSDWVWVSTIFFILSSVIQKVAIQIEQKKLDRMRRYGVIGRETTRLLHDLKGLLSSPVLLLDSMQEKQSLPKAEMDGLVRDMRHALDTIQSIHTLVREDKNFQVINVLDCLKTSALAVERRLNKIQVIWPESRTTTTIGSKLHSVFFGAFVLILETVEQAGVQKPTLEIIWSETSLLFTLNALFDEKTLEDRTDLIMEDALMMGARLEFLNRDGQGTIFVHFADVRGLDATA